MSLRRLLFIHDASDPLFWVDRYVATGALPREPDLRDLLGFDPDERIGDVYFGDQLVHQRGDLTVNRENLTSEQQTKWDRLVEQYRNERAQRNAAKQRAVARDIFTPDEWCYGDADDVVYGSLSSSILAFYAGRDPAAPTQQFVHWCDTDLARACLAEARKHSLADIDAMEPTEQIAAVRSMWDHFARYFRAINVRPWSWAAYRNAWEYWVGPFHVGRHVENLFDSESWGSGTNTLYTGWPTIAFMAPMEAEFITDRPRAYLYQQRPSPHVRQFEPSGSWGPLRRMAAEWMAARNTRESLFSTGVVFGRADQARGANDDVFGGNGLGNPCVDPTRAQDACGWPTAEAHPVWISNTARFYDHTIAPEGLSTDGTPFDEIDSRSRDPLGGASPGSLAAKAGGWTTGGGTWYSAQDWQFRDAGTPRFSYYPPPAWYAVMLWPLLEYLAARTPEQIIYETRLDVLGKNIWTVTSAGQGQELLQSMRVQAFSMSLQTVRNDVPAMVLGGAATIATLVNPVVGAVVGAATAGLRIIHDLIGHANERSGAIKADIFGRLEPVIEQHAILPGTYQSCESARNLMPAPPPGYTPVATCSTRVMLSGIPLPALVSLGTPAVQNQLSKPRAPTWKWLLAPGALVLLVLLLLFGGRRRAP